MAIIRLELRDPQFNLLEILDEQFMDLSWENNRVGGCGSINFGLPREYCNEKAIGGDYNLRVYVRNPATKAYDIWYQGLVEDKTPNARGEQESVTVQGMGYQVQLSRIQLVNRSYAAMEISDIIKDLLDNDIVPNTDVSYDPGDVTSTGFIVDDILFNTDVLSAIQTLADIAGARDWGVNAEREFFFIERSTTVGFEFPLGRNIVSFSNDDSFRDVVNRVIVQGGDVADAPFIPDATTAPYNDLPSQLKYSRRDQVYTNASIITDDVARQFAASILAEKSDIIRRARCEIVDYEQRFEATLPIPLFQIIARSTLYGEKAYGTFLYSGRISYQINRIQYRVDDANADLRIQLELGQPRPNVSEYISQLKYQIEQQRSARL